MWEVTLTASSPEQIFPFLQSRLSANQRTLQSLPASLHLLLGLLRAALASWYCIVKWNHWLWNDSTDLKTLCPGSCWGGWARIQNSDPNSQAAIQPSHPKTFKCTEQLFLDIKLFSQTDFFPLVVHNMCPFFSIPPCVPPALLSQGCKRMMNESNSDLRSYLLSSERVPVWLTRTGAVVWEQPQQKSLVQIVDFSPL